MVPETTTGESADPEAGPDDDDEETGPSASPEQDSTTEPSQESQDTTGPEPSESGSGPKEGTNSGAESGDASGNTTSDQDSGDSKPDSSTQEPDPDPDPDPDDGSFDFIEELTGPRPCSNDAARWTPVEKYRGELLGFPRAPVKALEKATLTGPCDATLIGPDIAITGAQCRIRPGETEFVLNRQSDSAGSPRTPVPVEVASIVETKFSESGGYEYTIFRLSEPVSDEAGWVKMAALRLDKDDVVGMVHAPKDGQEVFSAGTVIQSGRGALMATRSLHAQDGSQGAGVVDSWGFLVATHVTGSCCDNNVEDCPNGKELGWQSPLFSAYAESPFLRSKLAAWMVGGPGEDFACDGERVYGIEPGGTRVWRYTGTPDKWEKIGPAAVSLHGGGGQIYARQKDQRVFRFTRKSSQWEQVAANLDPEDVLDVDKAQGDLYRLPADRQSVERLGDDGWEEIGGPASTLHAIHNGVLAQTPDGSAVWRWNPSTNKWQELGEGGIDFIQSQDGSVFRQDRSGVFELRGVSWSKLSGPVQRLAVGDKGKRTLFALDAETKELMQYNAGTRSWDKIGRPSRRIYMLGTQVFAVDDKSRDLVEYRPQ